MPKSPTERSRTADFAAPLQDSIECLNQQIRVLTEAVDQLFDELQWRNNEHRTERESSPPPTVLRSMPADPTTDDWRPNRVSAEAVDEVRERVAGTGASPSESSRPHDQLCRKIADLWQIVAALVIIVSGHDSGDLSRENWWLIEWASQEFDPDMLKESLPPSIIAEMEPEDPPFPVRSASQPTLFAAVDDEAD